MATKTLFLFVDDSSSTGEFSLRNMYLMSANKHNQMISTSSFPDSGFDVFYPGETGYLNFFDKITKKIDFKICAAMYEGDDKGSPAGYYMYPRSSLSKTALRLANSVGIIDSGYRGHLCGLFDIHTNQVGEKSLDGCGAHKMYEIEQAQRLVQICAADLKPFRVVLVDSLEELGITPRGDGGIGSTGSSGQKK